MTASVYLSFVMKVYITYMIVTDIVTRRITNLIIKIFSKVGEAILKGKIIIIALKFNNAGKVTDI